MQLFMLCFLFWFCRWTNRNKAPYILQLLNFAIFWANFLREVVKVKKYLKAVKTKIVHLCFWTKSVLWKH